MNIRITPHAEEQIRFRKLARERVIEVAANSIGSEANRECHIRRIG